jgi:hypothetical protein
MNPMSSFPTAYETAVRSFTVVSPPPGDSVPESETREQEPLPAKEAPLPQAEAWKCEDNVSAATSAVDKGVLLLTSASDRVT